MTEARAIIYGVPLAMTEDPIKRCIGKEKVLFFKRLKSSRGRTQTFHSNHNKKKKGATLPNRVKIGGYQLIWVKLYIPALLRCYKCQRFCHVSAVCNRKMMCGKCGREHLYENCMKGMEVKCINCGDKQCST